MLNVKDEILFDARDEFGRWVVDDSKSEVEGDNEAFSVQHSNKKGEKIRCNLPTRGEGDNIRALYRPDICW